KIGHDKLVVTSAPSGFLDHLIGEIDADERSAARTYSRTTQPCATPGIKHYQRRTFTRCISVKRGGDELRPFVSEVLHQDVIEPGRKPIEMLLNVLLRALMRHL